MQSTRPKVIMALLVVLIMVLSGMVFLVENAPSSGNSSASGQLSVSHSTTGTLINHSSPPAAASGSKTNVLSLAQREKLQQSAIQQAKQLGIPMKYLYLPDYTSKSTILNGHVTLGYISSPAPMGVADYGLMNQSGSVVTYNYTTSSFMASINLNNFSDFNLGDFFINSFRVLMLDLMSSLPSGVIDRSPVSNSTRNNGHNIFPAQLQQACRRQVYS